MKRKITGMLVALLVLICVSALAEEPLWSYDGDNMYLKLEGTLSGDVVIPSEVNGHPVNAMKNNAFYEQHEITSLTMPDSLRALNSGVVTCMDGLTRVTLNDGLEFIGSNFTNCNALTSLTIPASVRIVH
ncbi:MAG: leucine-rich repeat protein, partial [Clostridia bacterium]|nr:leucine-rich repeat protein [Clostridia bacterium]